MNLREPVAVIKSNGEKLLVYSVQAFGDPINELISNRGINLQGSTHGFVLEQSSMLVAGTFMEANTSHHYTPVVMKVNYTH